MTATPSTREPVWIVLSVDERTVIAVADSAERAKTAAQDDAGQPLTWRQGRHGRLVNEELDYELRPFVVLAAADHHARPAEVVHLVVEDYSATRCCYRSVGKLPRGERWTEDPDLVTCGIVARPAGETES